MATTTTPTTDTALAGPTAVQVQAFRAPEGCVAYLVTDRVSREAIVLDPRLDQVAALLEAVEHQGFKVRLALDTHTHADHLSGVECLARRAGAEALRPEQMSDGDTIALGDRSLRVIPTPGHTQDAVSLYIDGHVFTGDALFVGGAGRTDFPGGSSAALFDSFRRFEALADDTVVHPGHDYRGVAASSIGAEKQGNPLMQADRAGLAKQMDVRGPAPANMKEILEFNQRGPADGEVGVVELDNLLRLGDAVQLIDIRNPSEFAAERIAGAVNIALGGLGSRLGEIDRAIPVVAMCNTGVRTIDGVRRLKEAGFVVRALKGGINAWKAAGRPIEGRGGLSIERQTQLTIGVTVLAATALGFWVHPWFLAISAFFGAGLAFAGATGSCALAAVIAKMPWNRDGAGAAGAACAVGGSAPSACAVGGTAPTACAVGGGLTE